MKRFGAGRVRRKLANMLYEKLTEAGYYVRTDPEKLIPNQGYWRIDYRADCMPWTGGVDISLDEGKNWRSWNVESWDTMTTLIRGFHFEQLDGWTFELFADHPATKLFI